MDGLVGGDKTRARRRRGKTEAVAGRLLAMNWPLVGRKRDKVGVR
jgi:hypothetical protein